jgi:hypothetical protein
MEFSNQCPAKCLRCENNCKECTPPYHLYSSDILDRNPQMTLLACGKSDSSCSHGCMICMENGSCLKCAYGYEVDPNNMNQCRPSKDWLASQKGFRSSIKKIYKKKRDMVLGIEGRVGIEEGAFLDQVAEKAPYLVNVDTKPIYSQATPVVSPSTTTTTSSSSEKNNPGQVVNGCLCIGCGWIIILLVAIILYRIVQQI